mgnify:CR=1 FL=1
MLTRITLEQWRMFVAVVEHGGFAQAAEQLCKTQSAVSHAVKKMETLLGQKLFEIHGRKAILTDFGEHILPRARKLVGEAIRLEQQGQQFKSGSHGEIAIAIDQLYPQECLIQSLALMTRQFPGLSIRIHETTLSGTRELLEDGLVGLGLAGNLPTGHLAEPCYNVTMVAVMSPKHPLASLEKVVPEQLAEYPQVVLRDSGKRLTADSGWLGGKTRLTVSQLPTAITLTCRNQGYAWLPFHAVDPLIKNGELKRIPLEKGAERSVQLQLGIHPDNRDQVEITTLAELLTHPDIC